MMAKAAAIKDTNHGLRKYSDFLCGWGAGCIETVALFPTNKIIFRQMLHGFQIRHALHQLHSEGLGLLYRGLLPPLLMRTSTRALMFGMYDRFQVALSCPHSPPGTSFTLCHAQAAFLAGTCEAALLPLERVQVLLQTSAFHDRFRNTAQAFKAIRPHGIREYYRGLSVVLIRNGLSNGLFFTLREPLRRKLMSDEVLVSGHTLPPVVADFVSGGLLGACISTLFFPLNVVKNRMQSQLATPFENPIRVLCVVWGERGSVSNMLRGVPLNFTRSMIAWGITNTVYEALRRHLEPWL